MIFLKNIKFISLVIVMMFLTTNSSLAEEGYNCAVPDWSTNCITRTLTNAMGMNFTAKKVAQIAIKKALTQNADGDYKIKIGSRSAFDLKAGKFESIIIDGQNLSSDGIYVSKIHMQTVCSYNHIDYNKDPVVFYTDMPIAFNATITEDDLNNTFANLGYVKRLSDISLCGFSFFTLDDIKFKLKNNKIYLLAYMKAPVLMGNKPIKFTYSGKLNVEDGRIVLENLEAENMKDINLNRFVNLINRMNPFELPLKLFEGNNSTLNIKNVRVLDNQICVDGIIIIKRSDYGQKEKEEK